MTEKVVGIVKKLVFPEGVPYRILGKEVIQFNGLYVDHFVDLALDEKGITDINPLMHIIIDVEINGNKGSDKTYSNMTAEFFRDGKIDYNFWNAKQSKKFFYGMAEIVDMPHHKIAYWCLGHDIQGFLRDSECLFRAYYETELKKQMAGEKPERKVDLLLFRDTLKRYDSIK